MVFPISEAPVNVRGLLWIDDGDMKGWVVGHVSDYGGARIPIADDFMGAWVITHFVPFPPDPTH